MGAHRRGHLLEVRMGTADQEQGREDYCSSHGGHPQVPEASPAAGKKIFTDHVGKWNLSEEGPDFRNARLIIDGAVVDGDIEVHFEPKDWQKHKHHLFFALLLLHVMLK